MNKKILKFKILLMALVGCLFSPIYVSPVFSIYGGDEDNDSKPYVGYMMLDISDVEYGICGINFLSPTLGITAAHCIEGVRGVYPMIGVYTDSYEFEAPGTLLLQKSPYYNTETETEDNAAAYDIAVVELKDPVDLDEFAQVGTPQIGCNYYMVGYGTNEDGESFDRRGIDVCITDIKPERFSIISSEGHFCTGDSGTGIYEKDSSVIVGLVSTFLTNYTEETCDQGTDFFATRIDTNASFIDSYGTTFEAPGNNDFKQSPITEPAVPADELDPVTLAILLPILCCCGITPVGLAGIISWLFIKRNKGA